MMDTRFIKNLINRLFKSWRTSLIGVVICVITYMYYSKAITTEELVVAAGVIGSIAAWFMKDPAKNEPK